MLQGWLVVLASFGYIGLLFAIAWYADRRAKAGRSMIANPVIYSLSLAVYATAWTFYGSVGRAAHDGVGFLPIYLGPTLMIVLWWFVVRKIRFLLVPAAVLLAGALAAPAGAASTDNPHTAPVQGLQRVSPHHSTSSNWSGYAVTGATFQAASARISQRV